MIPVVTPDEMAAVDAAAADPVDVLIDRAGAAVARVARLMMGGTYGRRVVVLAGPGNNGADGRVAGGRLERMGATVTVADVAMAGDTLPPADLYVDAAFGTGLKRAFDPPARSSASSPVLAVDIPSGVDGVTGQVVDRGGCWPAERTITFAALKPGLLLEPGRSLAGAVEVADIGLPVGESAVGVVEQSDVAGWLPERSVDAHKWATACRVVGGGSGMTGAATLVALAAMRSGAGFVQLVRPGVDPDSPGPVEAVRLPAEAHGWSTVALDGLDRIAAMVIGPGLGSASATRAEAAEVVATGRPPIVLDADAIVPEVAAAAGDRGRSAILTPHDGEFARLGGDARSADRIAATVDLACRLRAHVLRKGPTTIVADPDGRVRLVTIGDQRLATAGTGDVLAGVIAGALARGANPFDAAAAGAYVHALAGRLGPREGLTAGDLVDLIPEAVARIRRS